MRAKRLVSVAGMLRSWRRTSPKEGAPGTFGVTAQASSSKVQPQQAHSTPVMPRMWLTSHSH